MTLFGHSTICYSHASCVYSFFIEKLNNRLFRITCSFARTLHVEHDDGNALLCGFLALCLRTSCDSANQLISFPVTIIFTFWHPLWATSNFAESFRNPFCVSESRTFYPLFVFVVLCATLKVILCATLKVILCSLLCIFATNEIREVHSISAKRK